MNIGVAATKSGVNAKMIRYYEDIDLIAKSTRSGSGYRRYVDGDVHTLRFIRRARDLGFSIERIRDLLSLWKNRSRRSRDVKKVALTHVMELNRDIEKLISMRNAVLALAEHCHGDDHPECPILEGLDSGI